ncbi:MAG: endonuclease [Bacteroidota bacterium]
MPEGPSILILKEAVAKFKGKKISKAAGNAKIDLLLLTGKKVIDIRTWGKQFFICLEGVVIRIHPFNGLAPIVLMSGQNLPKACGLSLILPTGRYFFYTCSVKILNGDLDEIYDWEADVLSDQWNAAKARKKLKAMPGTMVCDALLDQQVFSGVGNIIKNEVLYRTRLHPETLLADIPAKKLSELIREARNYSFDFLEWKKAFVLKKHWLIHTKKICLRCDLPVTKKYCGKTKRRTFFCENCQVFF